MERITGDGMTLMGRAPMTAKTYLCDGIKAIDLYLGDGYAKKHPELLSAFIQTCAVDLATAVAAAVVQDLGEVVSELINVVASCCCDRD